MRTTCWPLRFPCSCNSYTRAYRVSRKQQSFWARSLMLKSARHECSKQVTSRSNTRFHRSFMRPSPSKSDQPEYFLPRIGRLSPHVGNLTFLRELNLQNNGFHALIPQEIGRLFRLQYLRMANNSFQGKLPINLARCFDIRVIALSGNSLEAELSTELSNLSKLYELSLSRNNFTGMVPPLFANLSSLGVLDLSRNNFHGSIPVALGQLTNLVLFDLTSNKFSGVVPAQLFNISTIQVFSVADNMFTASLPPELGHSLPKLKLFLADLNHFSGLVPASLANASGLVKIRIGDNAFSGRIPLNLGGLQELQVLDLGGSLFGTEKANDIGFISSLTNCTNLRTLILSQIQIGAVLPDSITRLSTKLASLSLEQNYISGSIPVRIGTKYYVKYLATENFVA